MPSCSGSPLRSPAPPCPPPACRSGGHSRSAPSHRPWPVARPPSPRRRCRSPGRGTPAPREAGRTCSRPSPSSESRTACPAAPRRRRSAPRYRRASAATARHRSAAANPPRACCALHSHWPASPPRSAARGPPTEPKLRIGRKPHLVKHSSRPPTCCGCRAGSPGRPRRRSGSGCRWKPATSGVEMFITTCTGRPPPCVAHPQPAVGAPRQRHDRLGPGLAHQPGAAAHREPHRALDHAATGEGHHPALAERCRPCRTARQPVQQAADTPSARSPPKWPVTGLIAAA